MLLPNKSPLILLLLLGIIPSSRAKDLAIDRIDGAKQRNRSVHSFRRPPL